MKVFGIDVDFPYQEPYQAQRALMINSMRGFVKQENAILESPTGTGKSLALLTSSLAFQADMKNKHPEAARYNYDFSNNSSEESSQNPIIIPKIYFTSRTHTQLTQLVGELKKLKYTPRMSILASRKQTCIHSEVLKKKGSVDQECQALRKDHSCPYGQRTPNNFIPKELNTFPPKKYDIEEIKDICKEDIRCPYFVCKNMAKNAELVFAPYNYIIDPIIRDQMSINLKGSILIIDEAHNIEQTCRDAATLNLKYDELFTHENLWHMSEPLKELYPSLVRPYANIKSLLDSFCNYFSRRRAEFESNPPNRRSYLIEDDTKEAFKDKFGLTCTSWTYLYNDYEYILKVDKENNNPNEQDRFPNPAFITLLKLVFNPLQFVFSNNGENFSHFKIVYQYDKDLDGQKEQIKIICLNPGVVFNPISQMVHNVILTSGTLTPLNTFASELGTSFPILLSASHVIDPKQVSTITISTSPSGETLSSTFSSIKASGDKTYINLANILKIILPVIPDGVLFFIPSYSMKTDMLSAWKRSKDYDIINSIKKIFVEKQGSEDKNTLKQYKEHIKKCKAKGNKSPERGGKGEGGGLYIGVCRGKLSEGMDFHDSQARSVIIFGIPYPNIFEPEIVLKREYNDRKKSENSIGMPSQNLYDNYFMSGKEWYDIQAFRALFQAVGRCIRHKKDYGSIILIDERFNNNGFLEEKKFPKWVLRSWDGVSVRNYDDLKLKLSNFYGEMNVCFPPTKDDVSDEAEEVSDTIPFNLTCADCTQTIFSNVMLKFDSTTFIGSEKKGFLELIKEDKPQLIYIMKDKEKKESKAERGKIHFSENDLIVYEPILCSACGKLLGAQLICGSEKDIALIGSYLLQVNKFYANQNGRSQPFEKILKKPKVMQLKMETSGDSKQSILSFT